MRKIALLALIVISSVFTASCTQENPWDKPYVLINNIELIDQLIEPADGNPGDHGSYPRISGLLDREAEDRVNRVLREEAEQFAESAPAPKTLTWSAGANFNNLLNIRYYMYFSGKDTWEYSTLNFLFDLNTGKHLGLADLFADNDRALKLISAAIKEEILRENLGEVVVKGPFEQIDENQPFLLTESGLEFYFPPENPYFSGEMSFLVPFDRFDEEPVLLGKYYRDQPIYENKVFRKQMLTGPVRITPEAIEQQGPGYLITAEYYQLENIPNHELQERLNQKFVEEAAAFAEDQDMIRGVEADNLAEYGVSTKIRRCFLAANYADILCIVQHDITYGPWFNGYHSREQTHLYNIRTGQPLALKELFHEGVDYVSIINDQIRHDLARDGLTDRLSFSTITDEIRFYIDGTHLYIFALDGHASLEELGLPGFMIPFEAFGETGMVFY